MKGEKGVIFFKVDSCIDLQHTKKLRKSISVFKKKSAWFSWHITTMKIEKKQAMLFFIIPKLYKEGSIAVKSRDHQKAQLGPLTNCTYLILTSYSSIWKGVMRGTNSKNKKTRPKHNFFGAVRGWNRVEKSRTPKGTCRTPY